MDAPMTPVPIQQIFILITPCFKDITKKEKTQKKDCVFDRGMVS